MQYITLSGTDEKISKICLGTMMWGDQVGEDEAHKQMALALENGVNFWDTAEMYTIPAKAETYGRTESFIGNFFTANPSIRKNIILASKFIARGVRQMAYVRNGEHFANEKNIREAFTGSCERLNTDYLDLYQMHWPDRVVNIFGQRNYQHESEKDGVEIEETAKTLKKMVNEGKIKYIGISNETPWGFMKWIQVAKEINLPLVSIQNPYSLLNRLFEVGNSEIALRENIGLLSYSPLAMGTLSGKYLKEIPKDSRRDHFPAYAGRFAGGGSTEATTKYIAIAHKHGLSPVQMALAFVRQQLFVTSTIIGATTCMQLQENIDSIDLTLSKEVLAEIETVYQRHPDPCA